METQQPYCGDPECSVHCEMKPLRFGKGPLINGYPEQGCSECARSHEEVHPECGLCWPWPDDIKTRKEELEKLITFRAVDFPTQDHLSGLQALRQKIRERSANLQSRMAIQ